MESLQMNYIELSSFFNCGEDNIDKNFSKLMDVYFYLLTLLSTIKKLIKNNNDNEF